MKITDKSIVETIGCKYIPLEMDGRKIADPKAASRLYLELFEQGKKEGFTPVFIDKDYFFQDWHLGRYKLKNKIENYEVFRKKILEEVRSHDHEYWLWETAMNYFTFGEEMAAGETEEYLYLFQAPTEENGWSKETEDSYPDRFVKPVIKEFDISHNNFGDELLWDTEAVIALIPTSVPYEIMAWVTYGGGNDCPWAIYQLAFARFLYEKCGAVPVVINLFYIQYYLPEPIVDRELAEEIGKALVIFDFDYYQDLEVATRVTVGESILNFWWD